MGVIAVNDGVESRILAAGRAGRLVPETLIHRGHG
jgi:hypothetical protein